MSFRDEKRRLVRRADRESKGYDKPMLRSYSFPDEALQEWERDDSSLVCRVENNILLGRPLGGRVSLHYAYADLEAMRGRFADMLAQIENRIQAKGYRLLELAFDDYPNRTFVEPILRQSALEVSSEWTILQCEEPPIVDVSTSHALIEAAGSDPELAAELDAICYPAAPFGAGEMRAALANGFELVAASESGKLTGYALIETKALGTPRILRLGVNPERRGRGIALSLAAWVLEGLRRQGHSRIVALAPAGSREALALGRRYGFMPRHGVLFYAKEPGARPKRTLGLVGLRGVWESR